MARNLIPHIVAIASTCLPLLLLGQLTLEKPLHDFGVLARADEPYADFTINNTGGKDEIIFRVEAPKNVEVKMSSKTVAAGARESIRLHYTPAQAGPFDIEARIFASAWAEPRYVRLRGEATFAGSNMPCPDFSTAPAGQSKPFHLSLRDEAMQPVANASIVVYQLGRAIQELRTDVNGELSTALPTGRYFIAAKVGDLEVDTAIYASAVRDHVLLRIPGDLAEIRASEPEMSPVTIAERTDDNEIVEYQESIAPDPKREGAPPVIEKPVTGDNPLMPLELYKQNNVVFLVDVSTSMKQQGRLDLLKIAMTDLLQAMRDSDRFTLISYASGTEVLIDAGANLDRAQCAQAIMALEAAGNTQGAKAIEKAGKSARQHLLPEGNNQIILATDGAFNEGASKASKLVNKYRRFGINTSVLCIRCGKFATEEMQGLAAEGQGRFVPIEGAGDAGQRLIDEIKTSALR